MLQLRIIFFIGISNINLLRLCYSDTGALTTNTPSRAIYEISRVSKSDEGSYSCVAQSSAGTVEETVQVLVTSRDDNHGGYVPPPTGRPGGNSGYIETDTSRIVVPIGGRAELRCHVRG
jgi:hypothetical protein